MSSPFIYEDPLEPPDVLADRTAELALLRDRIGETRNSRLEGPRPIWQDVFAQGCAGGGRQGRICAYLRELLGVLSAADVAERIERAYRSSSMDSSSAGLRASSRHSGRACMRRPPAWRRGGA